MTSFLGIEGERASFDGAQVVLLPVPHDGTTTFHAGARHAPEAIVTASLHIEEHDEELGYEPLRVGIHLAEPVEPPGGDDPTHPVGLVDRVAARVTELIDAGKTVITLGGDHTVAVGAGRAHAARYPGLSFLQIDAHADLRDRYEGSGYNHACVARRLSELGPVVGVGIRSVSTEGAAVLADWGRSPFWARDVMAAADDGWMDQVIDQLSDPVYVTFDVDGLDPSIMPATGTPEPGGLDWYTTLRLLRRVSRQRRVVGADVCELLPTPGLHACDVLVARLVYKMVGYFTGDR